MIFEAVKTFFVRMNFVSDLRKAARKNRSLLCVGLDTDLEKIPAEFRKKKNPLFEYNRLVVQQTKDLVCSYKPNSAFYESRGRIEELRQTVSYIKKAAPDVPVILDAKRGDIGNTATHYARYCYDFIGADAVTLSPYMGFDSIEPFLEYKGKGVFVLCLTSNEGAADLQMLHLGKKRLFEHVAGLAEKWDLEYGNVGIVVGATKPEGLRDLRKKHPKLAFLVPGVGAQSGDLGKSVQYGTMDGGLCIFNASRQVLYPKNDVTIREAALELRDAIETLRCVPRKRGDS